MGGACVCCISFSCHRLPAEHLLEASSFHLFLPLEWQAVVMAIF